MNADRLAPPADAVVRQVLVFPPGGLLAARSPSDDLEERLGDDMRAARGIFAGICIAAVFWTVGWTMAIAVMS